MSIEIISTVLVPASATPPAGAYDLTTLATVHTELEIPTADTAKDAFLSAAITGISGLIANYVSRVFPIETVQDVLYLEQDAYPWQNPALLSPLQLSRWPLVNATPVAFTGTTNGTVNVTAVSSTAGLAVGMPVNSADGTVATTIASIGSGTLTLAAAASSSETALALTAGINVVQTLSALSSGAGSTQTLVYGQDYTIDATKGWLIRLNSFTGVAAGWEAIPTTVRYQAGFATIPGDLVYACLRMVTDRYYGRGRDPRLVEQTQPSLGTRRWWTGAMPNQSGPFPPEIEAILAPYRVPSVA